MAAFMVSPQLWAKHLSRSRGRVPGSRVLPCMEHLQKWMRGERRKAAFCSVVRLATLGRADQFANTVSSSRLNSRLHYTGAEPSTPALRRRCCSEHCTLLHPRMKG